MREKGMEGQRRASGETLEVREASKAHLGEAQVDEALPLEAVGVELRLVVRLAAAAQRAARLAEAGDGGEQGLGRAGRRSVRVRAPASLGSVREPASLTWPKKALSVSKKSSIGTISL